MQSTLPLHDIWIVNTRAAHQALPLSQKLKVAGANVIDFPLLEIKAPANVEKVDQQLATLSNYDLAIFISTNAVEQTLNKANPSIFKTLKLACVGKKTGLALQENGLDIDFCPERFFNSEALLALESLQTYVPGKKIALIKGEGGRDLLKKSLQKWGGDVTCIDVYRRICPQRNLDLLKNHQQRQELDIIILTSGFSIDNFFSLAVDSDWVNSVTLMLGSERLIKHIPDTFTGRVLFAEDPNDDTLLQQLTIEHKSL